MASSITFTEGKKAWTVNVEQVTYVSWEQDGRVIVHFTAGEPFTFNQMSDREKDALRRMLRITPV